MRDQASIAAKRKAAAERQAKRRERMRRERDPEAYAADQAAKEAAAKEAAEKEASAAAAKQAELEAEAAAIAALVEPLHQALTVVVDAAAGIVRRAAMHPAAPPLGHERADTIAKVWAPVLAPYLHEHLKTNPAIIAAALVTAGVCAEWSVEVEQAKPKRRPAINPEVIAPLPVPAPRQEAAA